MEIASEQYVEVSKFRFGAPVNASDGASGSVEQIVVDPASRTVLFVGVKLSRLSNKIHHLPIALIASAQRHLVELGITRDEVAQKAQIFSTELVRLTSSSVVANDGKSLGHLAQVSVYRASSALRRLVVNRGPGRGEVLIALTSASEFSAKRIGVHLSAAEAQSLTPFRPDSELVRDVEQALYNYPRLRIDLRAIAVQAIDGEVWLLGHVSSDLNSRLIIDQLQGIAGLAAVHNQLIADPDLAAAVAAALGADPQTRGQHIGVYPNLGEIYLRGVVDSYSAYEAATKVASGVPGIEKVVNQLLIRPGADVVPVLAGITGRDDLVPGGA